MSNNLDRTPRFLGDLDAGECGGGQSRVLAAAFDRCAEGELPVFFNSIKNIALSGDSPRTDSGNEVDA